MMLLLLPVMVVLFLVYRFLWYWRNEFGAVFRNESCIPNTQSKKKNQSTTHTQSIIPLHITHLLLTLLQIYYTHIMIRAPNEMKS